MEHEMPIRYVFREDLQFLPIKNAKGAKAQVLGEALAKIAADNAGRLKPKNVVEAARDPKHVMHRHFEWDDRKAADAHRLDQARAIIRVVEEVKPSAPSGSIRSFVSVNDHGRSYRTIGDVERSSELQMQVLAQAEKDLDAFQKRYRGLSDVLEHVAEARRKVKDRIAKTEAATAPAPN
jgi:folylpolyglutamate synthase/dihydropteroate synthase